MRLSEERYDNPAYRDIKNSIDTAKEEGREEGRVEGIPKKSWPPQNVFSAWGSHKSKLPKVQTFQ